MPVIKLTEDDVRNIRQIHADGRDMTRRVRESMTAKAIARKFDVSQANIEKILRYETWANT